MDGSFLYDFKKGLLSYRMTASFVGSDIEEGLLRYMISYSDAVVDLYNDRFLAVSKGYISADDFIEMAEKL